MSLSKRYNSKTAEPALRDRWLANGTYHFDPNAKEPVYSIDTPPPTVSGHLHMGHIYSYSQADFIARFWRMNGRSVYYPMGFDDNGLPTERLVEKREAISATTAGRQAFIERCLAISATAEADYKALWQRLGLSVDWRYTYRTIAPSAQRISQQSFLDLHAQGVAYEKQAPTLWCPECQTAIAQAELDDLERATTFYTLAFALPNGNVLPIATTRPELLPACVAIFVHPDDGRFQHLIGQEATTPLFNQTVPILADPAADPSKGSGAVMCCTFGDQTDVQWWHTHSLPLIEAIGKNGRLTLTNYAGMTTAEARQALIAAIAEAGKLLDSQPSPQTIRVHERCDTPIEFISTNQWFYRILDFKEELLAAGEALNWYPQHMHGRYRQWVENLAWDWCISRQRTFGVPIPAWHCAACGTTAVADSDQLPVDPLRHQPQRPCADCGSTDFLPETAVMDTWATSSMSPQIATQELRDAGHELFPLTLRPQAHEIIRTWAFYTLYKSLRHTGRLPFRDVAISGWGLAPEGMAKLSKSRGGGTIAPLELIEQYSADAVRYWAASTAPGRDAIISEEKVQTGSKLITKLWNVARFSQGFLADADAIDSATAHFSLADRWLLARTQQLISRVTAHFTAYDYAAAKNETEQFFWTVLADNYLEMAKLRLYAYGAAASGAKLALRPALLTTLKLFAPILPHITEQIYLGLFAAQEGGSSIHRAPWPQVDARWLDDTAVAAGALLVEIATAVRRYKSENTLSLGAPLAQLTIHTDEAALQDLLATGTADLQSITRAETITFAASGGEIEIGSGVSMTIS